jgi:hypothetical protein
MMAALRLETSAVIRLYPLWNVGYLWGKNRCRNSRPPMAGWNIQMSLQTLWQRCHILTPPAGPAALIGGHNARSRTSAYAEAAWPVSAASCRAVSGAYPA